MPLIEEGASSLDPDMIFGWRPQIECTSPPIPLYFDFIEHPLGIYNFGKGDTVVYQDRRPKDTY